MVYICTVMSISVCKFHILSETCGSFFPSHNKFIILRSAEAAPRVRSHEGGDEMRPLLFCSARVRAIHRRTSSISHVLSLSLSHFHRDERLQTRIFDSASSHPIPIHSFIAIIHLRVRVDELCAPLSSPLPHSHSHILLLREAMRRGTVWIELYVYSGTRICREAIASQRIASQSPAARYRRPLPAAVMCTRRAASREQQTRRDETIGRRRGRTGLWRSGSGRFPIPCDCDGHWALGALISREILTAAALLYLHTRRHPLSSQQ